MGADLFHADRQRDGRKKRRDRHDVAVANIFVIVLLSHLKVMLNFAIKATYKMSYTVTQKYVAPNIFTNKSEKKTVGWMLSTNMGRCECICVLYYLRN
jgi:hypothetical protein